MAEAQGLYQKALKTVQKHQMIQRGDTVAAGVSGGADSVAMLDFFYHLRERMPLQITVCHLNHQLRGEESDRDEAFVRELAERYRLPFLGKRVDAAAWAGAHRCSVEEAGRELRYAFLQECAGEEGKIATAHTLSDSMETLLLNLCRGSGVRGLRGIPPVRGRIVRPLSGCTRQEVEDYCREQGLCSITDSTNLSPVYSRNRLRLRVLPELELINPALPAVLEAFMARMDRPWELLEGLVQEAKGRLLLPDGRLDREGLLALSPPVREALLLGLLEEAGARQSSRLVEEMEKAARAGRGELPVKNDLFFTAGKDWVELSPRRPAPAGFFQMELELSDPAALPAFFPLDGNRKLAVAPFPGKKGESAEKINKSALKNRLDCGRIKGTVILRRKIPGDRMAPAGRSAGSHPLKKLCQEAGIPPEKRQQLVVGQRGHHLGRGFRCGPPLCLAGGFPAGVCICNHHNGGQTKWRSVTTSRRYSSARSSLPPRWRSWGPPSAGITRAKSS